MPSGVRPHCPCTQYQPLCAGRCTFPPACLSRNESSGNTHCLLYKLYTLYGIYVYMDLDERVDWLSICQEEQRLTDVVKQCGGSVSVRGAIHSRAFIHSNKPKAQLAVKVTFYYSRQCENKVWKQCVIHHNIFVGSCWRGIWFLRCPQGFRWCLRSCWHQRRRAEEATGINKGQVHTAFAWSHFPVLVLNHGGIGQEMFQFSASLYYFLQWNKTLRCFFHHFSVPLFQSNSAALVVSFLL